MNYHTTNPVKLIAEQKYQTTTSRSHREIPEFILQLSQAWKLKFNEILECSAGQNENPQKNTLAKHSKYQLIWVHIHFTESNTRHISCADSFDDIPTKFSFSMKRILKKIDLPCCR